MAGKKQKKPTLAEKADRHVLYEKAVQNVAAEIDFVDSTFSKLRGRTAKLLREDFCGTANTSCEWVRRRSDNVAWGVDIDPEVLDWSRGNKLTRLTPLQRRRLHLINENVLKADCDQVDLILAMNFSYWIFKQRSQMKRYFRRIHRCLSRDGIFFLDAFGGYEASREMEESTLYKGFTYVWDQASYNPINGDITCHIHFRFKDRSKIKNAFTYNWRLWTLPELQEILEEAGFRPAIYWEGTDKHGEGDGVFTPATVGEADAGWIAYIVAEKKS